MSASLAARGAIGRFAPRPSAARSAPALPVARGVLSVRSAARLGGADIPKENSATKVLVVGGTGYIGKFVVRGALRAGLRCHRVRPRQVRHRW